MLGDRVGTILRDTVGVVLGFIVGVTVGCTVGTEVLGCKVGVMLGFINKLGEIVGDIIVSKSGPNE